MCLHADALSLRWADWGAWLKKTLGHQAMIAVALLAYTVRVYGYTLLTQQNYKMVLALEALHGFTFASMWTATVAIADEISPVPTRFRPPRPPIPTDPRLYHGCRPLLGLTTCYADAPTCIPAFPSGTAGL